MSNRHSFISHLSTMVQGTFQKRIKGEIRESYGEMLAFGPDRVIVLMNS